MDLLPFGSLSIVADNRRRPDIVGFVDRLKNDCDCNSFALLHDERRPCSSVSFEKCHLTLAAARVLHFGRANMILYSH